MGVSLGNCESSETADNNKSWGTLAQTQVIVVCRDSSAVSVSLVMIPVE